MDSTSRNFRKLLLSPEKSQNDHFLLGMYFLLYSEEYDDDEKFDLNQGMIHFERSTILEEDDEIKSLGYCGMALCEYRKDGSSMTVEKLLDEAGKGEIDILDVRKILIDSLSKQETLGFFEEMNKNLAVGYRMAGHAYLDTREEFDFDSEDMVERWEERDFDIVKKAQDNFLEAFERGDFESFQPLYDTTLELRDWGTMFDILEKIGDRKVNLGELLRKTTILSKNFEKGLHLLEKGGFSDQIQKVKSYMEMRKKFPFSVTGVVEEEIPVENTPHDQNPLDDLED